jgi:hypothetical protein
LALDEQCPRTSARRCQRCCQASAAAAADDDVPNSHFVLLVSLGCVAALASWMNV